MSANDYMILWTFNAIQIIMLLYICGVVTFRFIGLAWRMERMEKTSDTIEAKLDQMMTTSPGGTLRNETEEF